MFTAPAVVGQQQRVGPNAGERLTPAGNPVVAANVDRQISGLEGERGAKQQQADRLDDEIATLTQRIAILRQQRAQAESAESVP